LEAVSDPWVKTIRRETGLIEHICEHGVGHPAIGSVDWMNKQTDQDGWGIHGCDGCCHDKDWQLASLRDSVVIANDLIIQHQEYIKRFEGEVK